MSKCFFNWDNMQQENLYETPTLISTFSLFRDYYLPGYLRKQPTALSTQELHTQKHTHKLIQKKYT